MSMTTDRILPLCELLLGAAYADKELKDQERDEVRTLLQGLAGEDLPAEVEDKIKSFDPDKFDLNASASAFKSDSEDDRKKLLHLVSAVNEADDELDFAEDDYLRELATALELPAAALQGLTVEVETEELKETFQAVVRKGPPPPPTPKAKSVDVDID
jgi:uncharacterized tellurite resistance protein B-like protein